MFSFVQLICSNNFHTGLYSNTFFTFLILYLLAIMPNKCAVVGCRVGYTNGPRKPLFHFPQSISLQEKWIDFLNKRNYTLNLQSCICIEHFDDKYIVHHSNRQRLNYSLAPIPTIHPSTIPKSQKILPKKPRKVT